MKKISNMFGLLAILLTNAMFAVVAYNYGAMKVGVEHGTCSAPAESVFLYAIPFLIGILACILVAVRFRRNGN